MNREEAIQVLAEELAIGDVIRYCGCLYKVTKVSPPDTHGIMGFETIKSVERTSEVVSESFMLARLATDDISIQPRF